MPASPILVPVSMVLTGVLITSEIGRRNVPVGEVDFQRIMLGPDAHRLVARHDDDGTAFRRRHLLRRRENGGVGSALQDLAPGNAFDRMV